VKASLGPDDYKSFVSTIRAYKSKTLGVQPLIGQVFDLFSKTKENNIDALLEGFAEYIPGKYQSTYAVRKSAFKQQTPQQK
jgi:hypothetical protein